MGLSLSPVKGAGLLWVGENGDGTMAAFLGTGATGNGIAGDLKDLEAALTGAGEVFTLATRL